MTNFLTHIHINKIFHLENIDIVLDETQARHLIITGKNGSGKTVLVNAMVEVLDKIKWDKSLNFKSKYSLLETSKKNLVALKENTADVEQIQILEWSIENLENDLEYLFKNVELKFVDIDAIFQSYHNGDFVFAFYEAERKSMITEPKNPTKPVFENSGQIKNDRRVKQLLNFLVDLKVQEALARNEGKTADADEIKAWFMSFEGLLKEIFQNPDIYLDFNYRDYSFFITDNVKRFKFTELSDGYSAIIDIVADLMLKMQEINSPTRQYLKSGLVIIDEIETHLHLELQRLILPMLTRIFPNIQFVVTTHSPFVLNSLPNAVAFDLEKQTKLEELTEYSFEALAEGYFGVNSESSYVQLQFQRLKQLAEQEKLSLSETAELKKLATEFEHIKETVAPQLKSEYLSLKISSKNRIAYDSCF